MKILAKTTNSFKTKAGRTFVGFCVSIVIGGGLLGIGFLLPEPSSSTESFWRYGFFIVGIVVLTYFGGSFLSSLFSDKAISYSDLRSPWREEVKRKPKDTSNSTAVGRQARTGHDAMGLEPLDAALHRAAFAGQTKRIRELLDRGAHVNAVDTEGNTPLDKARQQKHKKAARALERAGTNTHDEELFLAKEEIQGKTLKFKTTGRSIQSKKYTKNKGKAGRKRCAVCQEPASSDAIQCSKCGRSTFESHKKQTQVESPAVTSRFAEEFNPSVQHDESLDERIDRLWEDARKLGRSDAEQQRAIGIYTELLTLVDEQSTENDMCAFLRNRAIAHRSLKNYDAALEDHARELEIAQGRSDHMRVMKCRDLIEESKELKREVQIETAGGDKAARLHAMEEQGRRLWHGGPVFETAFGSLFADMENRDPDVRFDASRLLAKNSEALQRLVSIYQECVNSDPWRASLAGRVLGRQFRNDIIMTNAATTQRMYGISASFIHAPCVHCNHRNRGISAPPNGSSECFYAQNDDKGVYAVPVLCDGCGKKFFVVWDSDPR